MKKIAFLDKDNIVLETLLFDIDVQEDLLYTTCSSLNAIKFIDCENKLHCGIGNYWNEIHEKFVPPTSFNKLIYDFNKEAYFPETAKPETENIEEYDWDWDFENAEWVKKYPEDTPGEKF